MTDTPSQYAARLAAFSAALTASVPALVETPAVAPAAAAIATPAGLGALDAVQIAIKAALAFVVAADDAPSETDRAMITAGAVDALGAAGRLAAYAEFATRDQAITLRDQLAGAAARAVEALELLGHGAFAGPASAAIQSVAALAAAAIADINEAIGRLPSVVVFEADRAVDAFQLANHLYGADPASIEAGYRSIVKRNRPRHPAQIPAGRIEAVRP